MTRSAVQMHAIITPVSIHKASRAGVVGRRWGNRGRQSELFAFCRVRDRDRQSANKIGFLP